MIYSRNRRTGLVSSVALIHSVSNVESIRNFDET